MRGRAWAVAALGALLVPLTGCGGSGPTPDTTRTTAIQRVLDRRADAVMDRDAAAYRATGDAEPELVTDLGKVPLDSWRYKVTRVETASARTVRVSAELSYRVDGYDDAPLVTDRTLELRRSGDASGPGTGTWSVTADRPAKGSGEQLWEQGEVTVVSGAHSLVLGVGRSSARLRAYAALADHAVPAVDSAWGTHWARKVVLLVPKSLDAMGELLGAPASGYRGIAAVTTGEAGGSRTAPADRVIVNPDAYAVLGDFGKQVVLTHETTHVATRASTSAATPLWLSEGYADWVGYRGTGRTPAQVAPELQKVVRAGDAPSELPDDRAFRFSSESGELARAYESGWLACRMIADKWGERKLASFYAAVGAHHGRSGAVDAALNRVLGVDEPAFVAQWRSYVRDELG
ncbi:LPS-assembly lipoprotein LptE [Streptomyces beihaiensis]|uniref:Lipoprotein n=1 Tax=Streptomyces beihaiensis TaxID=2984495 RepID=A0ABT3TZA4_9ACTN|nr:hypothetical protein [Streptomyces beihaiensis]MCX3062379.1 hypothetical protein [Streptomyces beihaiensis]